MAQLRFNPLWPTAKRIATCFTKKTLNNPAYNCNICATRPPKDLKNCKGDSNLISHLDKKHGETWERYCQEIAESKSIGNGGVLVQAQVVSFVDKYATNIYNWVDLYATIDIPLTYCKNERFLKQSKYDKVCYKTMHK